MKSIRISPEAHRMARYLAGATDAQISTVAEVAIMWLLREIRGEDLEDTRENYRRVLDRMEQ